MSKVFDGLRDTLAKFDPQDDDKKKQSASGGLGEGAEMEVEGTMPISAGIRYGEKYRRTATNPGRAAAREERFRKARNGEKP